MREEKKKEMWCNIMMEEHKIYYDMDLLLCVYGMH